MTNSKIEAIIDAQKKMKHLFLILFLPLTFISCNNANKLVEELKEKNNLLLGNIKVLRDSLNLIKIVHHDELYGCSVKPDFKYLKYGDTAMFSVNVNYGRPGLIQEIVAVNLNDGEDIFSSDDDKTRIDFQTKPQNFQIGSQKIKITNYKKGINRLGGYLKLNNFRSNNEYPFEIEYEVK